MNIVNINSNEQENSMRDRSVRDIHLEKAFVYVIDANLKVFAEAIGVLAKISEQILFQPFHDCLVLSAFNSTKSAYGKITFYANFFSRCESNVDVDGLGVGGDITCRISARSALHIFKNVCTRSGGLHMPGQIPKN